MADETTRLRGTTAPRPCVVGTTAPPTAVLALDQGTTSSRAIVFGHDGTILGSAQEPFPQHYPEPGWVEHDPEDIWGTQLRCARAALNQAGLEPGNLAAIGVANLAQKLSSDSVIVGYFTFTRARLSGSCTLVTIPTTTP